MSAKRTNYYNRGIGYILFTAGTILTVWLGAAVWRGLDTYEWAESSGIIYQADIIETTQLGEQSLYAAALSYRFQFAGKTFSGENLFRTSMPFNSEDDMRSLLANFPIGSIQSVYVNPSRPEEAVLMRGVQPQLIAGFAFSVICFGIGLMSFRQARAAKR